MSQHTAFHARVLYHIVLLLLSGPWLAFMLALFYQEYRLLYYIGIATAYEAVVIFWLLMYDEPSV